MDQTQWISSTENLLTILILLPAFGAMAVVGHQMFWKNEGHLKWVTLGLTLLNFVISLLIFTGDKVSASGFMFEKNIPWIKATAVSQRSFAQGGRTW